MKLNYRNQKNAEATAAYWGKPIDRAGWYKIEASAGDEAEIMIYDVIGWPFNDAGELVRAITDLKGRPILGRINSPGGDVFDSFAIFNAFASHDSKVTMRIESMAASAASFIALAGKEVQAYKNAMMMIHNPMALVVGNQDDMREAADILEKISGNMVDIYASESNVGKKEIRAMMKAETWMTAKEAKEKGFIDTIVDGKAAKAQFDLSMFANAPADLMAHDSGGRKLTEREIERALRDAGASRNFAKAVAVGRSDATSDTQRDVEDMRATMTTLISSMAT